ncbi:MAG: glycosyl transferase family 28 [Bacteroidota bacterium]|nr:glycosyl transferase family 28 [Bacteroidota bacterium]
MKRKKRILVAPLDWGLGHATRCIPLIRQLLAGGAEIFIASSGNALQLLQQELPNLRSFEITGYNPVYPNGSSMVKAMTGQMAKFIKAIAREHDEIETLVEKHNIDVIISDNRYGCYSKKARSIFITHQLNILMPFEWKWIERGVNYYNHKQIKEFSECWVPAPDNKLLKPLIKEVKGVKARYIGHLSRFEKRSLPKKYDVLVICSGPEPQKGIFEKLLTEQLQHSPFKSLVVRGEPASKAKNKNVGNAIICNFMNAEQLNNAIAESDIIVSRSGYSSVMDLAKLEKKAIFIATPGQTEQEYLATELMKREIAFSMKQSRFDLIKALKESENFTGFMKFEQDESLLKNAIQSIL